MLQSIYFDLSWSLTRFRNILKFFKFHKVFTSFKKPWKCSGDFVKNHKNLRKLTIFTHFVNQEILKAFELIFDYHITICIRTNLNWNNICSSTFLPFVRFRIYLSFERGVIVGKQVMGDSFREKYVEQCFGRGGTEVTKD